jgi:hypothetical protein
MGRIVILALICGASLQAEVPPPEKFHSVRVIKIFSDPTGTSYSYTLSGNYVATSPTPINAKEGSEVKYAIDGAALYLIDGDGKTHQCQWGVFDSPYPIPPPKKK